MLLPAVSAVFTNLRNVVCLKFTSIYLWASRKNDRIFLKRQKFKNSTYQHRLRLFTLKNEFDFSLTHSLVR